MAKVIAKQENNDGSKTIVVPVEGDQTMIVTGFPPYVKDIKFVAKDKLRETLAKIMRDGMKQ